MELNLKDKTAFISGSTYGIGFAIAKMLAIEGVSIIINGRTNDKVIIAVNKLKEEIPKANISGFACDFSKKAEIDLLISQIPIIDILVNNVGFYEPVNFENSTDEDWMAMFEVNVMSGVRLSRNYLPKMLKGDWGRIIFISSESALQVPTEMIHYGMSKTAQLAIANGLAQLTKGTHVTINSVLPGPTYSEGVEQFIKDIASNNNTEISTVQKDFFEQTRPLSLLQRFIKPEEVASAVTYLCSPIAAGTNGSILRVDGGIIKSIH
jgi:NAD(P)-dependent dehydrogenase (short-subunit alcohol dehydrogenase family)